VEWRASLNARPSFRTDSSTAPSSTALMARPLRADACDSRARKSADREFGVVDVIVKAHRVGVSSRTWVTGGELSIEAAGVHRKYCPLVGVIKAPRRNRGSFKSPPVTGRTAKSPRARGESPNEVGESLASIYQSPSVIRSVCRKRGSGPESVRPALASLPCGKVNCPVAAEVGRRPPSLPSTNNRPSL